MCFVGLKLDDLWYSDYMGYSEDFLKHLSPDVRIIDDSGYTVPNAAPVPASSPRRRQGGKQAQAGGRDWEDVIRAENATLPQFVTIIKTDPPSRIIRRGNQLVVVYEKFGPPDWAGAAYNLPIFFESKSTGGNTWSVSKPTGKDKGNWHQWEFLNRVRVGNPAAFVGYYIFWSDHNQKRFHFLKDFTPDGKTQRLLGLPVVTWWDAFLFWKERKS